MKNHTHKYQKVYLGSRKVIIVDGKKTLTNKGRYEVFKCMIPGCTTYKVRELIIGQPSICWHCEQQMLLDAENTRLKRPTHVHCRAIREKIA